MQLHFHVLQRERRGTVFQQHKNWGRIGSNFVRAERQVNLHNNFPSSESRREKCVKALWIAADPSRVKQLLNGWKASFSSHIPQWALRRKGGGRGVCATYVLTLLIIMWHCGISPCSCRRVALDFVNHRTQKIHFIYAEQITTNSHNRKWFRCLESLSRWKNRLWPSFSRPADDSYHRQQSHPRARCYHLRASLLGASLELLSCSAPSQGTSFHSGVPAVSGSAAGLILAGSWVVQEQPNLSAEGDSLGRSQVHAVVKDAVESSARLLRTLNECLNTSEPVWIPERPVLVL